MLRCKRGATREEGQTVPMRALVALAITAMAVAAVWFIQNRPVPAPEWTKPVMGMSYNPSHLYSDEDHEQIAEERLRTDLAFLSTHTDRVRTYSVSRGLDRVPSIAAEFGMKVTLGIWIGEDRAHNREEIDNAIRIIRATPWAIDRVIVGNEAILRADVSVEELNAYIRQVKRAVRKRVQVGTAEPWNVWAANPDLGREVDFLGAHMLPYWEGISLDQSMPAIAERYAQLQREFPGKEIVIGEVGWPSEGRIRRGSVPSGANQAAFIRRFLADAEKRGYVYYLIEAFDQPWKAGDEGAVGAYWGLFDAASGQKVSFTGLLTALPNWSALAFASVMLALVGGFFLLRATPHLTLQGQVFLAGLIGAIAIILVGIVHGAALEYAGLDTYAVFLIIVPVAAIAIAVIVGEAVEFAHSMWRTQGERNIRPATGRYRPKVSIHVPCYNEPPEMVIETLNALARLDYPDFEVILLDNNTKDEAVWRPLERHCATLGPRFRFFHMDGVKGFKAGALNEALKLTAPDAEVVAVIDSDYVVSPEWLKVAVPYFADPNVALVQAPQDYRDAHESLFKQMSYQEYTGFFRIGMVERDEYNAIIQHGTMTMMRASVMRELGGWATNCITEDSELGLRIFERGYDAVYINYSLGRGVMPDTLAAYKVQRHRWAYGAMQILKSHWRELFLGGTKLTLAQRYHFIAGWLPWIADGLALVFVAGALLWTVLMTAAPKYFDLPMASLASVALGLFFVKTLKTLLIYPERVSQKRRHAWMASIAGLALSHTVGKAVISGLFTSGAPFLRTPKMEEGARLKAVLAIASEEIVIMLALWAAIVATAISWGLDEPVAQVWMFMLAVQSLPYLATLVTATVSAMPAKKPVLAPVKTPVKAPATDKAKIA